ncbi:MAG TPA: A24 family peptidase [Anaerolineae bacterium]|nr:A24 family peptidase [Anaerolineae bacterium]HQI85795.1 A24 family peptidase [Anaerolineae bacterium]
MTFVIALFGLVVGTLAVHTAEAVMAQRQLGKPLCAFCSTPYAPLQWSATLALVTGRGHCRACGKFFRLPRLIGELFTALSWGLLVGLNGLTPRVVFAMLAVIPLTMIMVTDLEAKRVPNAIMLPAIGVIFVVGTIFGPPLPTLKTWEWWYVPAGGALAFIVLRLFVTLGVAVFGPGAMGEGDITLATYTGAVVGFPLIIISLLLMIAFGGIGALGVVIARKGSLKTAIPYGPFIILGCVVTLLWGPEILRWFLT